MSRKLADVIPIRLDKDLQTKLRRLADKNGRTRSDEMRAGLNHWTRLHQRPELHVHLLAALITLLITRIEHKTGKRWLDDLVTARAIREQIVQLIEHFGLPYHVDAQPHVPADVPVTVEPFVGVRDGLRQSLGVPAAGEGIFADQDMLSWMIRDLDAVSAGFKRNRAWEIERKGKKS